MTSERIIQVYADWEGLRTPALMGRLAALQSHGSELYSFEFDGEWLSGKYNFTPDPYLQNLPGKFFPQKANQNFGVFIDAMPGTWGRAMMQLNEVARARKEKRVARSLNGSDFLLNTFDFYRQGALRFKENPDEEFVTSDEQYILPSLAGLRDLEFASMFCREENSSDPQFLPLMEQLLPSAAALGGKRPKANVIDDAWQMWMAKFPMANDVVDVGGWEFVANTLAGLAGIRTTTFMKRRMNSSYHTFIAQRFDRNEKGERIHFATAGTLLGADFSSDSLRYSYIDLAELLLRYGSNVNADLEELWRRMVFNIVSRNTEDHIDNHGFLLNQNGWMLSPVYDLNPIPDGNGLSLNISEKGNALDVDLAMSVAKYFRLKPERAKSILTEVKVAVGQWNKIATDAGLPKAELEKMEAAFTNKG